MFDHPSNPRYPTPWYGSTKADTYGEGWANFFNAAFLWDESMTVSAGDSLRLRYRSRRARRCVGRVRLDAMASDFAT